MNTFLLSAAMQQQGGGMGIFIMMGAVLIIFWLFMIRPQQKKQKEINNFRNSLTVGQAVVTIGGLHGTIKAMDDTTVTLHVATGVDLRFEKAAINPTGTTPVQA